MTKKLIERVISGEELPESEMGIVNEEFLEIFAELKERAPEEYLQVLDYFNEVLLQVNVDRTNS